MAVELKIFRDVVAITDRIVGNANCQLVFEKLEYRRDGNETKVPTSLFLSPAIFQYLATFDLNLYVVRSR